MKLEKILTVILLLGLCLCQCRQESLPKTLKAEIIAAGEDGYRLRTVTFKTLAEPKHVDGLLAELRGNAKVNVNASEDVIISDNPDALYFDRGNRVNLSYSLSDGIVYPLDYDSAAMLTIYYHYEIVASFWEEHLGLNLSDFGKRSIFYDPKIRAKSAKGSISGTSKLNAAFVPGVLDFWFFRTSNLELVPFKMNLGILAHEFTHAVFDYRFAHKDAEFYQSQSAIASEQLNGINEGLADFFSWIVTGREHELSFSLEDFARSRNLPVAWSSADLEESANKICSGGFYCKGSVLASALYEISLATGAPIETAMNTYASLDHFREEWKVYRHDDAFDYHHLISHIIRLAPTEKRDQYCFYFLKRFNDKTNLRRILATCRES